MTPLSFSLPFQFRHSVLSFLRSLNFPQHTLEPDRGETQTYLAAREKERKKTPFGQIVCTQFKVSEGRRRSDVLGFHKISKKGIVRSFIPRRGFLCPFFLVKEKNFVVKTFLFEVIIIKERRRKVFFESVRCFTNYTFNLTPQFELLQNIFSPQKNR